MQYLNIHFQTNSQTPEEFKRYHTGTKISQKELNKKHKKVSAPRMIDERQLPASVSINYSIWVYDSVLYNLFVR